MASPAFNHYTLSTVLGWIFVALVVYLTYYVLSGMQTVEKISKKWKRTFIIAQVCALIYLINRVVYYTLRADGIADIDEDNKSGDWQMVLCSTLLNLSVVFLTLAYVYYSWFWFIRLEIIFENAAKHIRVNEMEKRVMKYWSIGVHIYVCGLLVVAEIPPRKPVRQPGNVYSCRSNLMGSLIVQSTAGLSSVIYLCLIGYLCYAYIRRLKLIMASGSQRDNADGYTEKELLAVRKAAVITITSVICSGLLMCAFIVSGHWHFLIFLDMFLNCLFIACYFKFATTLYQRVFCLCERYSDHLDACCGLQQQLPGHVIQFSSSA